MKKKITPKKIIRNLDAIITGATLTACVVIANLNVIMRYFFNHPLQWNDEVVTGLFVWTVFIGSAYAYRKHAHLGVDIVTNALSPKRAGACSSYHADDYQYSICSQPYIRSRRV